MTVITAYQATNGKLFLTEEEAVKADNRLAKKAEIKAALTALKDNLDTLLEVKGEINIDLANDIIIQINDWINDNVKNLL